MRTRVDTVPTVGSPQKTLSDATYIPPDRGRPESLLFIIILMLLLRYPTPYCSSCFLKTAELHVGAETSLNNALSVHNIGINEHRSTFALPGAVAQADL